MAVHRLDNSRWGFRSQCFVCEPSNPGGLQIPFFHDDESGQVFADFRLGPAFSGAPSYVHGGITLALLDEAMAWAAIAQAGAFALTERTTTVFRRAVRVDDRYRVEARASGGGTRIEAEATVRDGEGRPCAEAGATFRAMTAEQARSALGVETAGGDAGFVRG